MLPCYFVFFWLSIECRVLEGCTKWSIAPSMPSLTYSSLSWEHDIHGVFALSWAHSCAVFLMVMFPVGLFLNSVMCPNLVTLMLADVQFITLDLSMLSGCRDDFYHHSISVKPNLFPLSTVYRHAPVTLHCTGIVLLQVSSPLWGKTNLWSSLFSHREVPI